MAWARYDDELPMNKKVAMLLRDGVHGCGALGLHVLANTWSRHNGTAGFIPSYVPGQLVGERKLGDRLARILFGVGMFDGAEDGWIIHDFDDFSDPNDDGRPAAEKKRDISEKRAASGKQGGLAKAAKAASKTSSKSVAVPEQTSGPVPVPVPSSFKSSDNSNPENTPRAGDNSLKRDDVLDCFANLELATAIRDGLKIRTEDGFLAHKRKQGAEHPDMDRWLAERPTAPASAVAAWMAGDKHSMAYYPPEPEPESETELATVHLLRSEAAS